MNYLTNVKIIQFEYGGTYLDSNIKLIEIVNYLKNINFTKFAYLHGNGVALIHNFEDNYKYCNIVCINETSDIQPY